MNVVVNDYEKECIKMKEEYEFQVSNYTRRQCFRTSTKLEIEGNTLKIKQVEDMENVKKMYSNPTGEYDIKDIKEIKKSSMFLIYVNATIVWIILTLLLIISAITSTLIVDVMIIYIIMSLLMIIFCRARTIKIVLKDNQKIQIPIKMLKYESIEYKQNVENCIEEIKRRM